jgi:hypothetical protein
MIVFLFYNSRDELRVETFKYDKVTGAKTVCFVFVCCHSENLAQIYNNYRSAKNLAITVNIPQMFFENKSRKEHASVDIEHKL